MNPDQNKHIENACMTLAVAMAEFFAAVRGPTVSETKTVPTSGTVSRASLGLVRKGPTLSADIGEEKEGVPCRRVYVYFAGSRGCADLAATYGTKIMAVLGIDKAPFIIKCGTTTQSLAERLCQIGKDEYGAAVRTRAGIEIEPGFKAWIAHTISTSRQPNDPAVVLTPRAVAVDLPAGMTRRAFDGALHRALERRSLASVSASVMRRRFVAYNLVATRVSAATEFYAMSPHDSADGDLLLDAIEKILRQFRAVRD